MKEPKVSQQASGVAAAATQTGGRRQLRGRRGGLQGMPDMPLDILFEIFGFLDPRDVLNLARTSKAFRALLMSRNSTPFWKQARRKFKDLPDPPSYLSEPAYANLLFSSHCHNCLTSSIHNVIWIFSARFCKACYRKLFTMNFGESENLMWRMTDVEGQPLQMANLVYSEKIIRRYKRKIFRPEIETMDAEWAMLKTYDEREKYIHERRAFVTECSTFADRMIEWKLTYDATKSSQLCNLKEECLRAVKERLYDEGWGHMLDNADWSPTILVELSDLKTVNKAAKLTDKVWTNMRASVVKLMQSLQDSFIKDRLNRVCSARLAWIQMEDERLHRMYYTRLAYLKTALQDCRSQNIPRTAATDREPGFAEFASMLSFRGLIIQDESDDIVLASLDALLHDIPNHIAQWTHKNAQMFARKALVALGMNFERLVEDPAALLSLAVVSFGCIRCRRTGFRWPGILAHPCLRARRVPDARTGKYDHAVIQHTSNGHDASFLGSELTVFDPHIHITCAVVSACGFDPYTATFDEIEGRGIRFVSDVPSTDWQQVDDWQAVRRFFMSRPECVHPGAMINVAEHFLSASQDVAAVAMEHERWALSKTLTGPDKVYGCGLCVAFGQYSSLLSHLHHRHHVLDAEALLMDRSYLYLHEDSKPQGVPTVWLAPA